MKVLTPRHSFSLDYTPKQWVGLCNTMLLLLVAFMCIMVIYGIHSMNQTFVTILDSSAATMDFLAINLISAKIPPIWRPINEDISVYSAFHRIQNTADGTVLIIGSSSSLSNEISLEDIRCLVSYGDESGDVSVVEATYEKSPNCSTLFLYCPTKGDSLPKKVVLISSADTVPRKWIEVETLLPMTDMDATQTKIAACVQPFDEGVSAKQVGEFVSFYEALGLNHFYFYDYNTTQDSADFVGQLVSDGHSIDMLPWNMKMGRPESCHSSWSEYVQDCLHRAANRYTYVLTVDIFDFFVPAQYTSLVDILDNYSDSFDHLQINKANYCNLQGESSVIPSILNMAFRGSIQPSDANYFLRPDLTAAIESHGPFPSRALKGYIETLPKYEGIVRHLDKKCDSNVKFDALAYRYFKMMDKSIVLHTYQQTQKRSA